MKDINLIVLDIETYYSPEYSLSKKGWTTERYIRDEQFKVHGAGIKINGGTSRWITGAKFEETIRALPWEKSALIGHNLAFDGGILAYRYGIVPALYVDTLGMSRALVGQQSQRHGLHAVAPIITGLRGEPLHKMDGLAQAMGIQDLPQWREDILADYTVKPKHWCDKTQQWEAGDAELTWEIFKTMAPHFPKHEYKVLDWTIRQFTQPKLFLDDDMLQDYLVFVQDLKAQALQRAGLDTRDLLMSNQKYADALMDLGVIPPTKVNAKGKVTFAFAKTDEAHKDLLQHDNVEVQCLVAARMQVKSTIEETRTISYLGAAKRGAWPVGYNFSGAYNTQRFSGNNNGGGNPMNLKRGGTLRNCIMAPEGYTLLVFDLSQIECRLALWYGALSSKSNGSEREALDMFREGDLLRAKGLDDSDSDLYSFFASMMYGRKIVKGVDKLERQGGKSAVLGLGFGMGPSRFIDYNLTLGNRIEAQFAESTVHLYRNTYVGTKNMWRTFETGFKKAIQLPDDVNEGWSFGPAQIVRDPLFGSWGFKVGNNLMVKYPELGWDAEGSGTYRTGNMHVNIFGGKFMENLVQHSARNVLTEKLSAIDKLYPVVMTTYDEVVILIPISEIDTATKTCYDIMVEEHPLFPNLPLGVEHGHHQRYGKAKS